MSLINTQVKSILNEKVSELEGMKELYVNNPDVDFCRNRKWKFMELIRFILSMNRNSITNEILNYKGWKTDSPTASSFVQQRQKLLPELFEYLFHTI